MSNQMRQPISLLATGFLLMMTSALIQARPISPAGGGMLMLDGIDDYAFLPFERHGLVIPAGIQEFTVEAWVYPNAAATEGEFVTILGQQIRFESWPPGTIGFPKSDKNSVSVGLIAHLQGGGIQSASLAYANLAPRKWSYLALLLKDGKLGWAHNDIITGRRAGWNAVGNMNRLLRPKDFIVGGYHEIVAELLGVKLFNKMTYFSGYIDEIRISKVARYNFPVGGEEAFNPPRRLEADRHTLALWHFDDKEGATLFSDASGNGHTLIGKNGAQVRGTLSVNPFSSISTTWGKIKSQ